VIFVLSVSQFEFGIIPFEVRFGFFVTGGDHSAEGVFVVVEQPASEHVVVLHVMPEVHLI